MQYAACFGPPFRQLQTGGHSEVVKQLAEKQIPRDTERDSVWHEAYDLWASRPSATKTVRSFLSDDPMLRYASQRMLASVLKAFSSMPSTSYQEQILLEWLWLREQ